MKFDVGDGRNTLPRFQKEVMTANQKLVEVIGEFAARRNAILARLATCPKIKDCSDSRHDKNKSYERKHGCYDSSFINGRSGCLDKGS